MVIQNVSKDDIIKIVREKNIRILNLCHIPEDGRLKTLSFTAKDERRLADILELGERVDGSSLFPYVDPYQSDIYIMPKPESYFFDPFSPLPALDIMCEYLDENGKALGIAPESTLLRAETKLDSTAKILLKTLAEIEFYIKSKTENARLTLIENNYHETNPFAMFTDLRNEALVTLEELGFATKYGHSEVGRFYTKTLQVMEQHEIEFLPQSLRKTAEGITIAKWVLRNLSRKFDASVSFSPKPSLEHAGNGMHLHLCGLKEGANVFGSASGQLTDEARQVIGGILKFAPSLAAFGNTIPVSYLRFISQKESPMKITWGMRNRSALIRIPLWWNFEKVNSERDPCRKTIELRAPDPSANNYLLLAGIAVAVEYGLKNPKETMKISDDLNADSSNKDGTLSILPLSCEEAAEYLERDRSYYEETGVFPKVVIDGTITKLRFYKDKGIWERLMNRPDEIAEMLQKYLDYG